MFSTDTMPTDAQSDSDSILIPHQIRFDLVSSSLNLMQIFVINTCPPIPLYYIMRWNLLLSIPRISRFPAFDCSTYKETDAEDTRIIEEIDRKLLLHFYLQNKVAPLSNRL